MASSPTLKKVAELAGTSLATASMALNNRPGLSPETRARVIKAAEALGYKVKRSVFDDLKSDLSVIGLLIKHDLGEEWEVNPFYSHIQLGVANECRQHKINLMYANIEFDANNRPVVWPVMINEQHIHGLILAGTFPEDAINQIKRRANVPLVFVDSSAPNQAYDSVVINNTEGARQAINYLIKCGHTHIGLVGWNPNEPPSVQQRYQGYMETLQQNHLNPFVESGELSRLGGYTVSRALKDHYPEITAIFACNDETAIGVITAMQEMGLRVPEDLSVIGFDNIGLAGEIKPGLTTVHVPKSWMGTICVRLLIERSQNPARPIVSTVVSTQLVIRESVKDINKPQ